MEETYWLGKDKLIRKGLENDAEESVMPRTQVEEQGRLDNQRQPGYTATR